jgi:glycosyltransferase involved in cell wall biosynthesis
MNLQALNTHNSAPQCSTPSVSNRIGLLKFVTCFGIGGTERQVVNFARGLDHSRFELHVACFRRWGHYLNEINTNLTPLTEYNITRLSNPTITLREQVKFARYVRRNRIHIVHTYGFYPNVFAIPAAWLAGVPVIVASMRDLGIYLTPKGRRLEKFVCRLADRILVNAQAVKRWLIAEGYGQEKITVINNGIDLSRFTTQTRGSRLREELGLPQSTPLIATLCRLHPFKGIETFLDAAAIVAGREKDVRFLIVGDCFIARDGAIVPDVAYRTALEGYAHRCGLDGRVVFTGDRLDVPEVLSEVAVSVLPSLSEGLSNTLLESMAAGVPVVATTVGGNPEVVQDGVTGLLVPPQDPAALARAICRLLEDRAMALRFGQAGRQRVTEHFSLEKMVRETESLYLSLLNGPRQGKTSTREATPIRSSFLAGFTELHTEGVLPIVNQIAAGIV